MCVVEFWLVLVVLVWFFLVFSDVVGDWEVLEVALIKVVDVFGDNGGYGEGVTCDACVLCECFCDCGCQCEGEFDAFHFIGCFG